MVRSEWLTARDNRDSKAEGVQAEGRRSEHFSLRPVSSIAPSLPVLPVSLESGIRDCSSSIHAYIMGLGRSIANLCRKDSSVPEQFEDIFEASRDAIGYAALDGAILLVNRAFSELSGFPKAELLKMNARDLIPEQHKEQRDHIVAQVLQTGKSVEHDIAYLRKDGSQVPVSVTVFAVKGDDGKPTGLAAIIRDLTGRKQAEEALARSNERLALATRSARIGVWDWNIPQNELIWDDQMFALYGVKKEGFGGAYDAWISGVHPDDRVRCDGAIQQALRNEKQYDLEFRILWPNGTVRVIKADGLVVRDPQGSPLRMIGTNYDITERQHVEQQFHITVEASPNGLLMVDEQGTIRMVNRQIDQLFGYERTELIGQPVEMLVPQRMRSHHAGDRKAFIAHSESRAMGKGRDLFGVRKDGTEFPLEIGLNPVQTPYGMSVLASVVDISERKRVQEQLQKAERLAELGTLASGMAHEIGTPMNVILGRAEYLLQRTDDKEMKRGLATIVTQIERITKVMNQLLAFARRKRPERRTVDLGEILEDSLEMFQERMTHGRITVEKTIEAEMPPVYADRDQLVQVLINLVTNSLHAMPEGGRLRLSLDRENRHLRLGVSDTGHGMTEEIRSMVFEPFFTTKDFGKGTGLGLTVVKGIIEEHGGTITVESVVDKGTTFWIRLPLDEAPVKK
jgi:PAS domain S-box-containing protein